MGREENVALISSYFEGHGADVFDQDSEFRDMSLPEPYRGAEAIGAWLDMFYQHAFSDAHAGLNSLTADEDRVVAEFTFSGRNTGPMAGNPPTGRQVSLPTIAVYEIEGPAIRRARLYYDSMSMARQLGRLPEPTPAG